MHRDSSPHLPETRAAITGPFLRPQAAAAYLGISISSFYSLIQQGLLPAPIKLGTRASCVPKDWLDQAMSARAARAD